MDTEFYDVYASVSDRMFARREAMLLAALNPLIEIMPCIRRPENQYRVLINILDRMVQHRHAVNEYPGLYDTTMDNLERLVFEGHMGRDTADNYRYIIGSQ